MKDNSQDNIADLLRNHTAERIYESWFNQQRGERKRRLHFVMELSIELAKIKEQITLSTGLAELGIESIIEGDWKMVTEWADHFSFKDERDEVRLNNADVYARFRELLLQAYETRPGVAQGQA